MSSQTRFSAQAQVRWIQPELSKTWEKKAEHNMKSDIRKHRNDIAGQLIDIEWHVCPGDTCLQMLHKLE